MVRQHHGKESEWGAHCSLVAPTYFEGPDLRRLRRSGQIPALQCAAEGNPCLQLGGPVLAAMCRSLTTWRSIALSTLLALELRGAVLCDVGPSNLMVRAPIPYPPDDLWGRGWVERPTTRFRHRGVGNFESVFRGFPSDPDKN